MKTVKAWKKRERQRNRLVSHSLETSAMIGPLCVNYDEYFPILETFLAPKAALVSLDCTFKVANGQENSVGFYDLLLLLHIKP